MLTVAIGGGLDARQAAPVAMPGAPATPTAQALLAALKTAAAEHKTVLVEFGASWCAPCRQLRAMLAAPITSQLIAKHYILLNLTMWEEGERTALNNPGAEALFHKWGATGGIPFVTFLDATGNPAAAFTGYPSPGAERRQFMTLLDHTAPGITPVEHAAVLRELKGALGSIAGRIIDERGPPVSGARVTIVGGTHNRSGQSTPVWGPQIETDQAGVYVIDDIAPGEYRVFAEIEARFGNATVSLLSGDDRSGLDIGVTPLRTTGISGTVVGSNGEPIAHAPVTLTHLDGSLASYETVTATDGSFNLRDVQSGRYNLWARSAPSPSHLAVEAGGEPVLVDGADMASIAITTKKGGDLSGRLSTDGGLLTAADRAALTIAAIAVDPEPGSPVGDAQSGLNKESGFELRNVFGSRVIRVTRLPSGWMLKTVRLNAQDVTDKPIDLTGLTLITGVEVIVTRRGGEVSGTAVDADEQPLHAGAVIIFAEDRTRWNASSRFVKMAPLDGQGMFTVRALPAASYLVAAVTSLPANWDSAASLERLQSLATPFTLSDGERKTLAVRARSQK